MDGWIALVPMAAWGSIALVSNKIGGSANQQTLGMTIGALIFSIAVFFVMQPPMNAALIFVGILSGVCWSIGQNQQFYGMKYLGVSVGLPVSTGMQLIVNTVAGALVFHEWRSSREFVLGILALVLLVLGSYLTARRDTTNDREANTHMMNFQKGFRALLVSTVGYGAYTIIINASGLDPLGIILPQSVGMLVGASFFAFKRVQLNRFVWLNMSAGLLWGIGNICMLVTMQKIGLAISFSLSQMGIIISTVGGIVILGEKKTKKEIRSILIGCLLVIVGGILLGYMKSM